MTTPLQLSRANDPLNRRTISVSTGATELLRGYQTYLTQKTGMAPHLTQLLSSLVESACHEGTLPNDFLAYRASLVAALSPSCSPSPSSPRPSDPLPPSLPASEESSP